MKCLFIFSLLTTSLSLGSGELYIKQADWEWRDLPSIFDLNTGVRGADYGRSDELASQDWSWSDSEKEREIFRASDININNNNINNNNIDNDILSSGLLKKTSRLEPSVSE